MPRIYFTGRRKISARQIQIRILPGDPPPFQADIDLRPNRKKLPDEAYVVLEAFDSFRLQRFDLGTVVDCRPRDDLVLRQFKEHDSLRFRLRVVDAANHAVLVAACDMIRASRPDDGGDGGESMFPIVWKPDDVMEGELWLLRSSQGLGHELWLNRESAVFKSNVQNGQFAPLVHGCIIPAALRQVLDHELRSAEGGQIDPEWLGFARAWYSEDPPIDDGEDEGEREDWIDRVVKGYCRKHGRFLEKIKVLEESLEE